jgi:hypothetical protein
LEVVLNLLTELKSPKPQELLIFECSKKSKIPGLINEARVEQLILPHFKHREKELKAKNKPGKDCIADF